jgi:hypothetical protein
LRFSNTRAFHRFAIDHAYLEIEELLRKRYATIIRLPFVAGIAAPLPEITRGMSADAYARRLEELLLAETLATEACTDRLQWL